MCLSNIFLPVEVGIAEVCRAYLIAELSKKKDLQEVLLEMASLVNADLLSRTRVCRSKEKTVLPVMYWTSTEPGFINRSTSLRCGLRESTIR